MNDKKINAPYFSKQTLPYYLITFFGALISVALTYHLFSSEQQKLSAQLSQTLPAVTQQYQQFKSTGQMLMLLDEQLYYQGSSDGSESARKIIDTHQSILSQIQQRQALSALTQIPSQIKAIVEYNEQHLHRVANNIERNNELLTKAILLANKNHQYISSLIENANKVSAQSTPLKANIDVAEHTSNEQLQDIMEFDKTNAYLLRISRIHSQLKSQLSLLTTMTTPLEFLSLKTTTESLSQFISSLDTMVLPQEHRVSLSQSLVELDDLFYQQDQMLGKWQGTLRRLDEYRKLLAPLKKQVVTQQQKLLSDNSLDSNFALTSSTTGAQASIITNALSVPFNLFLLGILVFSLLLMTVSLYLLYRRVHQNLLATNELVKQTILGAETNQIQVAKINTAEQQQLLDWITQTNQLVHSEGDYQALHREMSCRLQTFGETIKTVSWFIENERLVVAEPNTAVKVLNSEKQLSFGSLFSWRQYFSREDQVKIIETARSAKVQQNYQQIELTFEQRVPVSIFIGYKSAEQKSVGSQQGWSGVIVNQEQVAQLHLENAELGQQLDDQIQQMAISQQHDHETLSQMTVQAMLQSQNAALVSGYSSQPVYRQLERIYDWLREQQILAAMSLSESNKSFVDVEFSHIIYAAIFNAIAEAQLKQNQIKLALDANMASLAKIDVRLFSRLLQTFCRLVLKEQFNNQLTLSMSAVDQSAGQQTIEVKARVQTNNRLQKLPQHINRLTLDSAKKQTTRSESYFLAILKALHGNNFNCSLTDEGYIASFEIPVTLAKTSPSSAADIPLTQTNLLVLSADKSNTQIMADYLKHAKANVETLNKVDLFVKHYSLAALNKQKLDCVVLASDQLPYLAQVQQHIDSLAESKKPTLVVCQALGKSTLTTHGLYSLTDTPVCADSLVNEVSKSLSEKSQNNQLLAADVFNVIHYLPTQVEVLLAVRAIETHQILWRLLLGLGFKVRVVSDEKSVIKHWQTGRYLILMNEFDVSPFISLLTGKSIPRGVFSFNDDSVLELDEEQAEISKHWQFGAVPDIKQLDEIIEMLSPWLKEKALDVKEANKTVAPPDSALVNRDQDVSALELSGNKLFDHELHDQLPPAFNLEQYAKNQGSPELAVYMLDDYIEALANKTLQLGSLLDEKNDQMIQQVVGEINVVASIIAATGLHQIGLQLEQALLNNAYETMKRLLGQIKLEIAAIKSYADAI